MFMAIHSGEEGNFVTEPRLWGLQPWQVQILGQALNYDRDRALHPIALAQFSNENYELGLQILSEALDSSISYVVLKNAEVVAKTYAASPNEGTNQIFKKAVSSVDRLALKGNSDALVMMQLLNEVNSMCR
jgi:hypothetical protein